MLTLSHASEASETAVSPVETGLSDIEISRRVLEIRSRWSASERVRRRREAEDRFATLLTTLTGGAA